MMEHYERIRPGSKIAWPKCDCKPELKIGWRRRIGIQRKPIRKHRKCLEKVVKAGVFLIHAIPNRYGDASFV